MTYQNPVSETVGRLNRDFISDLKKENFSEKNPVKLFFKYFCFKGVSSYGASMSFLISLLMFAGQTSSNPCFIGILFFGLGFFSSCQTLGFTWLTKSMRPELIGRNSAFNSMFFMGSNGVLKQLGAVLLGVPALVIGVGAAANLLLIITASMLIAVFYACIRTRLFSLGPR